MQVVKFCSKAYALGFIANSPTFGVVGNSVVVDRLLDKSPLSALSVEVASP